MVVKVLKSSHEFAEVLVLENRGDVVLRFVATTTGIQFASKRHAYGMRYEVAYVPVLTYNRAKAIAADVIRRKQERLEFLRKQRGLPF